MFDANDTNIKEIKKDIDSFKRDDLQIILVRNKIDLINNNSELLDHLTNFEIFEISANDIYSVSKLKNKLINQIEILSPYTETIVSNSRHYEALSKALESILEVKQGLENNVSGDLLSVDIRNSIKYLAEITGEITNDDVLGNIFANFCIGK